MRLVALLALAFAPPAALAQAAPPPVQVVVAPEVRGVQPATFRGRPITIEFVVTGDSALIRSRDTLGRVAEAPVRDPAMMLRILADPRLERLWQPLLDWAGPGLEHGAERSLEAARAAYARAWASEAKSSADSSTRPPTRALLQYVDMLRATGRSDQAVALLRARLPLTPRDHDWGDVEWTMVQLRLASLLLASDLEAGLAEYRRGEAEMAGQGYAINFTINRAAALAENGRYAEALAAIDDARARFDAIDDGAPGEGGEKFPGSHREFDWIRACALAGLGRRKESAVLMEGVRAAPEPWDANFLPSSNMQVALRADLCLGDREALVHDLIALLDKEPFGSTAGLWLQPEWRTLYPRSTALARDAARDPRVVRAATGRVRQLPAALVPALNRWEKPAR